MKARLLGLLAGVLSALPLESSAQTEDPATERARAFFNVAADCHDRNDFDCAIDNYQRSLREVEKPKTLVRVAWACHEKLVVFGQTSDGSSDALSCAKSFYPRALAVCEDPAQIWERKGPDCERTQSQFEKLNALSLPPLPPPPGRSVLPPAPRPTPPTPPPYRFSPPTPPARSSAPLNHPKNLQIAGIVIGGIGLAGAAVGVGLSQTMPAEPISPNPFNANYDWTIYDYVTLGAAGVAVLGGVLWLSGKLMQPPVRVSRPYPAYRYY